MVDIEVVVDNNNTQEIGLLYLVVYQIVLIKKFRLTINIIKRIFLRIKS